MAGPEPPLEEAEEAERERQRRCAVKAEHFRLAAEAKKKLIEQENHDRARRARLLESKLTLIPQAEREEKLQLYQAQEQRLVRAMCKVWSTQDFEPVRVLGKGSFGIVHLARQRDNGRCVALKQMRKEHYREKNLRERAYCERHFLAEAASRWFVELLATFVDEEHFYMVMEFVPGGDLLTHLERKGRFSDVEGRFYTAELLEALDVVHCAGFVHRDVKPDNAVLSAEGHLKLLDFGICKADAVAGEAPATRRERLRSARGTPQYMAPEAIGGDATAAVDLWALGIVAFELLTGLEAFHGGAMQGREALLCVVEKVLDHARVFPHRLAKAKAKGWLSPEAEQLLKGLICSVGKRSSAERLRREPFFAGLDFATLHLQQPPIVPSLELQGPEDARFFPELGMLPLPAAAPSASLEWAHYEFNRESHNLQRPRAVEALFGAPATL